MKADRAAARTFAELVALVEDVRDRTVRIEVAIAGDPIVGVSGLQARVTALERERVHKRLFQVMVAIGTLIGSAVGAASATLFGTQK